MSFYDKRAHMMAGTDSPSDCRPFMAGVQGALFP